MASTARKQSRLGVDASVNFRQQSALCLAIARTRETPAHQLGFLQLANHWQRAADASDLDLRKRGDEDDAGTFTFALA